MNTYRVTLQANAEVPPQEFYCDAEKPGHAIAAALEQIAPCSSVVVACHLYSIDTQARISDLDVFQAKARAV